MGEGLANFPLFVYNNDNLGIFKTGKDKGEKMKAFLILEDGTVFEGTSIGSTREVISEIVFNTSMTGYLEVLTDPSYAGQAVVMTYPLIGNYGICYEDMESDRPWPDGYIVRELSRMPSNFRCEGTIQEFLEKHDIPGIAGIDTRALTKILREKGTDRSKFFRGQVDKYRWIDYGSSYLPSELNAAYLYAQLEVADKINEKRLSIWNRYWDGLEKLSDEGKIVRPTIPEGCAHNAHMFYLKARDLEERTALISYLKEQGVQAVFHYIPLHTAPAGQRYGVFAGEDRYTTVESEKLVRLPLYYNLSLEQADYVIDKVNAFYKER